MKTAAEARAAGAKMYFTGRPCKQGHVSPRWTMGSICVECGRTSQRKHYAATLDESKARVAKWQKQNQERVLAIKAAYRDRNREVLRQRSREYHERKPEIATQSAASRRASRRRAQPPWVRPADLRAIYKEARRVTRDTGVEHSVDHIIPLRHPLVCGLHVPWNLQVMPLAKNKIKANKWAPS